MTLSSRLSTGTANQDVSRGRHAHTAQHRGIVAAPATNDFLKTVVPFLRRIR